MRNFPRTVLRNRYSRRQQANASNSKRVGDHQRRITASEFIMVPAGVQHSVDMPDDIDAFEVYALHMHLYDETRHRFLKKLDSPFGALSDLDAWVDSPKSSINDPSRQ